MGTGKDVLVLGLKKIHVIIAALTAIVTPSVVVTASFYKAKSDLETKINNIQIQNVSTFAKTEDVHGMSQVLNQISLDVAEIKGEMREFNRSRLIHRRPSESEE